MLPTPCLLVSRREVYANPIMLTFEDRGQGLNHCICDVSHLLAAIKKVQSGDRSKQDAVTEYEEEMIPRGREEVECSMKNAEMLHDWEKVKQSPVFKDGFRPMKGHSTYDNRVEV